jgi:hypothetical protein
MKYCATLLLLSVCFVPVASAQDDAAKHIEMSILGDFVRIGQLKGFSYSKESATSGINFWGIGGRVSFQAYKRIKLEGEAFYDFEQPYNENFTNTTGGTSIDNFIISGRLVHGEFGPRVNIGHPHMIQPFVELKGGFMDFRLDPQPAFYPFPTFVSSINGLRTSNINPVLFPGGGLQVRMGPISVRADVGDEMYFNHGAHNNIRLAFGPVFRF